MTDARGNKKTGASAGCLEERKGRSCLSRYAAEATAEHVGRSARKMGFQSVVMKVQGSTYFRKKKKPEKQGIKKGCADDDALIRESQAVP
ncbi:small subunit ribosomal protein [Canna indica]|uniref:Small subunit ribosomal protein n=1 Tax=Canna indica TaxID=4628 RepID=A0AAQ3JQE2_9LILI|nr:small subunit ribosomal protein [Canna indica]